MVVCAELPTFSPFGLPLFMRVFNGRLGSPQRARIHHLINNTLRRSQGIKNGFQKCKEAHKFAQFLTRLLCPAALALAGPGLPAQSAQKEAGLARRRGGGASARFGGREGGGILRQKPSDGRALTRCILPAMA